MGDRGTSNHSEVTDFILVGFRVRPELHLLLFLLFLLVYAMILLGNVGMMAIIMTDPQLNTPMYFFLGNLSFIDLFYSSVIAPKAMVNFWSQSKSISFAGCVTQLFLFALFIVTEGFLLAAMAYDRFIAICNPLLYSVQMSARLCAQLVAGSYFCGCISSFPVIMLLLNLDYCKSNFIDHFTCDYFPLLQLSCSDTKFLEIMGFSCAVFTLMITLALIFLSYIYIISTIVRIPSTSQRTKAFSTCSSHMIVISISYGSCIFMYIKPSANERVSLSKGVAVLNISVAPMLNPFIYSLRNQQVKRAFTDMARKSIFQKQMK
nr:olfactory receptor 9K2-like [Camelus dromedarius]